MPSVDADLASVDFDGIEGPLSFYRAQPMGDHIVLTHRNGGPLLRVNVKTFMRRLDRRRRALGGSEALLLDVLVELLPELCSGCGQLLEGDVPVCPPCRQAQIEDLLRMSRRV